MPVPVAQRGPLPLTRAVEIVAGIAMVFMAVAVVAILLGPNGAGVKVFAPGDVPMSIRATIIDPGDFGDPLPIFVSDDGTESVFGLPVVELVGPTTTTVDFLEPTASQRVIWIISQLVGPLLGLAVAWPVRSMAASARTGDPFTPVNERRLWRIAFLLAVGGTIASMVTGMASTIIIGRSAAADLFAIEFEISFLPIVFGILVGALAAIWRVGVELRDEVEATI